MAKRCAFRFLERTAAVAKALKGGLKSGTCSFYKFDPFFFGITVKGQRGELLVRLLILNTLACHKLVSLEFKSKVSCKETLVTLFFLNQDR